MSKKYSKKILRGYRKQRKLSFKQNKNKKKTKKNSKKKKHTRGGSRSNVEDLLPIKFVRVHGCSYLGKLLPAIMPPKNNIINTFKVPPKTYIITFVKPGDILTVRSDIKDKIFNIYRTPFNKRIPGEEYSLFKDNDKSTELTNIGKHIMNNFNSYKNNTEPKLFFKNHQPGTIMNNIFINFQNKKCKEYKNCNIFVLNKNTLIENTYDAKYKNINTDENEYYKGNLNNLINLEGPGIYLLNICRMRSGLNNSLISKMRALSNNN